MTASVASTGCRCPSWSKIAIDRKTPEVTLNLEQHIIVDDDSVKEHFGAQSGSRYMGAKNWETGSPGPPLKILSLGSQEWQVRSEEHRMSGIVKPLFGDGKCEVE